MNSSLYLLFKAMKQDATVALSGESSDEVFGGYPWFHNEAMLNAPTFPWTVAFWGRGDQALSWLSPDLLRNVQPMEHIRQQYCQAIAEVPRLEGEDGLAARRREMFYLNQTRFLPFLLERKDRMSMASGFEARVPFCDYRLVEYVWNIPWDMKNADNIEKGILRRAFAGVLPDDVRNHKKSAYPSAQSPAYLAAIRDWARQIVSDPNAAIAPLIDANAARSLVDNNTADIPGVTLVPLYERIIQLNEWLKKYEVTLVL